MNTKNIFQSIKISCLAIVMLAVSGCQDWLDVNKSLDNPVVSTYTQTLPLLIFYASQLTYDHAEYGTYFSQALTTGGRAQQSDYGYKNGWELITRMNRHPQWRRHFFDIGANSAALFEMAEAENVRNFMLVLRTIKLYSTMLTTDCFGDIPHSQVYKSSAPPYDTQASIYEWMYQEADDLIALYSDPTWTDNSNPNNMNKTINKEMDRMFEGDMGKWGAFTKALKARLLLRKLPNWDNTPAACDRIIAAVDAALNDPNYADALYQYPGGMAESCCPWGPAQPKLNIGWPQARENLLNAAIPSRFFLEGILGAYSAWRQTRGHALDPRAAKLMVERREGSSILPMCFLDNNIGMNVSMKIDQYPNLYYAASGGNPFTRDDGYILLISKEELLFIKAEAQYWKNDINDSYETTKEAVLLNFERLEAMPTIGTSTSATETAWHNRFFTVKLPGATTFTIADLMQQKYVAMYLQPEQWTDMRRYNYSSKTNGIQYNGTFVYTVTTVHDKSARVDPGNFSVEYSLTRPYNLYEPYWNTPDNIGFNAKFSPNAWITRLNYDPETEEKYNRKELERLGAYRNPDWLKKRMIWAYKNNSYVTAADDTPWK